MQHVVDQVRRCRNVSQVIVAVDDTRVSAALAPYGTRVCMTSPTHPSGTDRLAEVARGLSDELLVNVQGDEPEIEPELVDGLIELLAKSSFDMVTASAPYPPGADPHDANLVKVVCGLDGRALYFSRSPIPHPRDGGDAGHRLHVGIYAYRREFLLEFASWSPTPLERLEKLEQLRVLERGRTIGVMRADRATHGIDTAEQYERFVERWRARCRDAG